MSIEEIETHFDALKEDGKIPFGCEIEEIRIHHSQVRRCYVKDRRVNKIAFYWDSDGCCYSYGSDIPRPEYNFPNT